MLLNGGPSKLTASAAPCMNLCWIISLTWDYVKYVYFKWAALCFGTFCLKANVPKQGAANLMEASNLNFLEDSPRGLQTELPEVSTASTSEDYPPIFV